MNRPARHAVKPGQQLTLLDATSIIVGIVIGVGIYETTPVIAASVTNALWLIIIWATGGLLSLIGALCYAELATRFPEEGGDYVYLSRAWGRRTGFLFAWAGFWIVRPANIGAVTLIFAHYAQQISPVPIDICVLAMAAVIVLTVANIFGVRSGKWLQNVLTAAKILGLLLIISIGLLMAMPEPGHSHNPGPVSGSNFYLAMILVLFTYGGWSNISYVAAEVIHPQRNILRSLVTGIVVITVIYIVINMAFLRALGLEGMSASKAIASDLLRLALGDSGAFLISALICITCLSAVNGMIFTEARIYYALGREHHLYRLLGEWNRKLDAPVWSLVLQGVITLVLIMFFGMDGKAFERLVVFSTPLYWFFFLLVGLALFRFRKEKPQASAFSVPFYPWTPIMFCLSTAFMLYAGLAYALEQRHPEVYGIIIMMVLGILVSFYDPPVSEKKAG
ncbi:MAG TPA: amino acid permease [Gammaproteobacteria bacterium]|nr:amino acid permease [Gammaproteobacteria bacterium]